MASTSRGPHESRPYQGYPYVNPMVIDAPSIDAEAAAKWTNLPRRPISKPPQQRMTIRDNAPGSSGQVSTKQPSRLPALTEAKQHEEDTPVLYIDVPNENMSNSSTQQNLQEDRGEDNLTFVEDTIFYDPFENRQIEVNTIKEAVAVEGTPVSVITASLRPAPAAPLPPVPRPPSQRPTRPEPINLYPPDQSSPALPPYSVQRPHLYRPASTEDGFSLSPLPVNDYHRPPPAYTEIAGITPPRVEVVVDQPTVGLPSSNRKLTTCQQCGLRVNTLMTREVGLLTHSFAITCMILCLLPFTALIYCTNCLKYRVHYCPNCNFKIGKENPCCCGHMEYYKVG